MVDLDQEIIYQHGGASAEIYTTSNGIRNGSWRDQSFELNFVGIRGLYHNGLKHGPEYHYDYETMNRSIPVLRIDFQHGSEVNRVAINPTNSIWHPENQ